MNNILTNFLRQITSTVHKLIGYITDLPQAIRTLIDDCNLFIKEQTVKFQNISATNIELGKYHLQVGNIKDAILRFRIAKMLFDKDNNEIDYWLGWAYFFKGDKVQTLKHLDLGQKFDKDGLANFIHNANNIDEVPNPIWKMINNVRVLDGNEKYYTYDSYNRLVDLPKEFIESFLSEAQELPTNAKILDFGCSTGLIGSFLDHKLEIKYFIEGVDENDLFIDYIKNIRGERGLAYNHTLRAKLTNVERIIAEQKYDVIFSFDSLAFVRNFSKYFSTFHKSLNEGGYFALLLPTGKTTMWADDKKSFVYDPDDITEQLTLAKFEVLDITDWSFGKKWQYSAFICKK